MTSADISRKGIVSCTTVEVLQGDVIHGNTAIPMALYSGLQLKIKNAVCQNSADFVMTSLAASDSLDWLPHDSQHITPDTWRWIDLINSDSSVIINLRRPVSWFEQQGNLAIGTQIKMELPEMGIDDVLYVQDIRRSVADTRVADVTDSAYVLQPVTGKFQRRSADVYELIVGDLKDSIRVTGLHKFWKSRSSAWVEVKRLKVGDKISTFLGEVAISAVRKIDGEFIVYNLEVFRAHHYFASVESLLTHNSCADLTRVSERLSDAQKTVNYGIINNMPFVSWRSGNVIGVRFLIHDKDFNVLKVAKVVKGETSQGKTVRVLGLSRDNTKELAEELQKNEFVEVSTGKFKDSYYIDAEVVDGLNSGWVIDQ